jgi:hypothetical protein
VPPLLLLALLHPSPSSLLHLSSAVYGPCRESVCDGGLSLILFFSSHRMPVCVPLSRHRQSSDLPGCTSNPCATRLSKRASISIYFPSSFSHTFLFRRSSTSMLLTSQ